ncbi:MAG: TolB family protein [Candidatus Binatia bacterium]
MNSLGGIRVVVLAGLVLPALRAQSFASCRGDQARRVYAPADGTSAQNPAFSAAAQMLLFTRFHSGYNRGDAGVYTLSLADGVPVVLLDEPGHTSVNLPGSSWNGATNRIAFSSDRQGTDEIWTAAPDGTGLVRVTHQTAPFFHYQEPSYAPDGQWIVFESVGDERELQQRGSIWKVRADGTGLTQLVDGPGTDTDNRQPNWSPSGDRILFQRRSGDSEVWNLYTVVPDGSSTQQVTNGTSDTDASWSPDGQWIVYSSDFGGLAVPNIFVVAAAGGTPVRVTENDAEEDSAPSWSADGTSIAFESHPPDDRSPAALWRIAVPVPFGSCSPSGMACDDANPCTTNDTCQAGVCTGTPNSGLACDDGNPCTRNDTCQAGICTGGTTPLTQCRLPVASHRAVLSLRDRTPDRGDRLQWTWKKGATTTQADFGNPLTDTGYTLCVYDQSAGADQLIMAHRIPAGGQWRPTQKGFQYRDRFGTADGIVRVRLAGGSDGRAKIVIKGRGACLGVPALPLLQDTTVTVQLSNGTTCWEAQYSTNRSNEPERFKATSD